MEPTKVERVIGAVFAFILYISAILFSINIIDKLDADVVSEIVMVLGSGVVSTALGRAYYQYFINQIKNQ